MNLNKEQRTKLLELCSIFFKEYPSIQYGFNLNNDYVKFTNYNEQTVIHWYQLCLTELFNKIWNSVNKYYTNTNEYINGFCIIRGESIGSQKDLQSKLLSNHPVDYLYDFVKECKNRNLFKKTK